MVQKAHKLQPTPVWLGRLRLELGKLALPAMSDSQSGLLSLSFEVPVEAMAAPPAHSQKWMYWHQPDKRHKLLGVGVAFSLSAQGVGRFQKLDSAYQKLQASWTRIVQGRGRARARVFMGFAFDPECKPDEDWQGFDNAGLYVPELLFEWRNARCVLTFNCFRDQETCAEDIVNGWMSQLSSLLQQETPASKVSPTFLKTELPDVSTWQNKVAEAVAAMEAGAMDKVVLTRQLRLRFRRRVAHRHMLAALAKYYPGCTSLSVSFGQGVLLAATPEQLFRMSAESMHCDALAGTFPAHVRQPNAAMEIHEHAPVVDAIRTALQPLCTQIKTDRAAHPLALRSLSHLYTGVHAIPKPGVRPMQLLDALHPTPAVGGTPRRDALAWIHEHEQLTRGWYTGGFGWLGDNHEAQISVILRCALIRNNQARLFAGAGITRVSDPEQELQETRLKFEPMLNVLTR